MRKSVVVILATCVAFIFTQEQDLVFGTSYYNHTMKWGSYRPQVIFGLKTRSEDSLINGIMWHNAYDPRRKYDNLTILIIIPRHSTRK